MKAKTKRPLRWASGHAGYRVIAEYERQLGRMREHWDKDTWRAVALALAARLEAENDAKSSGAPATRRSNIALVSYLAGQRIEESTRKGKRLTLRDAINQVYREWFTHQREMKPTDLDTLCREERSFRAKRNKPPGY